MICQNCGKYYYGRTERNKFCSVACFDAFRKTSEYHNTRRKTGENHKTDFLSHDTSTSYFRAMKHRERAEAEARKARMAARDAAYAAQFPELVSGARRGRFGDGSHLSTFGNLESDMMRKG